MEKFKNVLHYQWLSSLFQIKGAPVSEEAHIVYTLKERNTLLQKRLDRQVKRMRRSGNLVLVLMRDTRGELASTIRQRHHSASNYSVIV